MMNVLASNDWSLSCGVLYVANFAGALELGTLVLESLSYVLVIAVAKFSFLSADHVMCM